MTTTLADGRNKILWSPVRLPSFRLLWLGQSLSLLGDGFSYIAFAWITLSLAHSTLALGYVLTLQAVPRAMLTLVGGSLSDKWSTRTMMMFSSCARAVLMTAVGVAGLTGTLTLLMLLFAAAAFGTVDAFFQPARVSILPSVVEKDMLIPANALLGAGIRVSAVLGPAAGGIVVAFSRAPVAFIVDAFCFALCAVCVGRIRTLPRSSGAEAGRSAATEGSLTRRIRAGLRYTWSDARLRSVLALDTAVNFCYAGPFTIGFAALARTVLHGGSTTLGLLNAAMAGGAILGSLVGGSLGGRPPVGFMIAGLAGWLALGMGLLGVLGNIAAATMTVLMMGFGIGFQGVFGLSWIQRNIPQKMLSQVISVDMVFGYAAAPISLIASGELANLSITAMFAVVALALGATALAAVGSSAVRKMR